MTCFPQLHHTDNIYFDKYKKLLIEIDYFVMNEPNIDGVEIDGCQRKCQIYYLINILVQLKFGDPYFIYSILSV